MHYCNGKSGIRNNATVKRLFSFSLFFKCLSFKQIEAKSITLFWHVLCSINNTERENMKVAISHWQGRIAPVFDVSAEALLYDTDSSHQAVLYLGESPYEKINQLKREGVDILLCGAISRSIMEMFASYGVDVLPFLCGDVGEIFQRWRESRGDVAEEYRMPGCCRRRARGRPRWGQRGYGKRNE